MYKYVKSVQVKQILIAMLSFITCVLLLIVYRNFISQFANVDLIIPILGMFLAALLAWYYTRKYLVAKIVGESEKYDVYISYSHSDKAWVNEKLYLPLKELLKPDGSKLKIFFDDKSIGIGEVFKSKYMSAIVNSKMFIPIISKEYYKKNHCKNEMDLAYKRKTENLIDLFLIVFDYNYVPEKYQHINFLDISSQLDFMEILKKELNVNGYK